MTNLPSQSVTEVVEENGKRFLVTATVNEVWKEDCWLLGFHCVKTKGLLWCRK